MRFCGHGEGRASFAECRGVGRSDQLECMHAVRGGDVLYSDRWDGSGVWFVTAAFLGMHPNVEMRGAYRCKMRPS